MPIDLYIIFVFLSFMPQAPVAQQPGLTWLASWHHFHFRRYRYGTTATASACQHATSETTATATLHKERPKNSASRSSVHKNLHSVALQPRSERSTPFDLQLQSLGHPLPKGQRCTGFRARPPIFRGSEGDGVIWKCLGLGR